MHALRSGKQQNENSLNFSISGPNFDPKIRTTTLQKRVFGGILNSPWNYNSHETTTLECSNSTSWGPKAVTAVKWRLLHPAIMERGNSCTHNSRQTTTIPSQQPWNDESEAQQSLPQEHEILRRFMAVVASSALRNSLSFPNFSPPRVSRNLAWILVASSECHIFRGLGARVGKFHKSSCQKWYETQQSSRCWGGVLTKTVPNFPRCSDDVSCFVSWEMQTTENPPKIQIHRKMFSWERAK